MTNALFPPSDPNDSGTDPSIQAFAAAFASMPPAAMDDSVQTDADTTLSGDVLADNGNGPDQAASPDQTLAVEAVNGASASVGRQITLPSGALLTVNADGSFDYDPNGVFVALGAAQSDTDTFTYQVSAGDVEPDPGVSFDASVALSSLDGTNGFRLQGSADGPQGRQSVSSAGDLNNDGIDDLVIAAADASYVVFGTLGARGDLTGGNLALSSLDGDSGFRLVNGNGMVFGDSSVSSAGDLNGDGIDDLLVGQPSTSLPNTAGGNGITAVVFGTDGARSDLVDGALSLTDLPASSGFRIVGAVDDFLGMAVSSAGDVNGDGLDDVVLGAPFASAGSGLAGAGAGYVVFGTDGARTDLSDGTLPLGSLASSSGFRFEGSDPIDSDAQDGVGRSVSSAGDVNGDGIDDLIIGSGGADFGAGESYVVFGTDGARTDLVDGALSRAALDGTNGFTFGSGTPSDQGGFSVSSAGDVNGDGIDDLLVGAPGAAGGVGETHVVFGTEGARTDLVNGSLSVSALDGTNGFRIDGIDSGDNSGFSVSSAGDVNGDGIDDLIIGAPGAAGAAGESYVLFGTASGFAATFDLSTLNGTNGFRIDGIAPGDGIGFSVSSAGDVNGDGVGDLIIGARDANGGAGESYVLFGKAAFVPVVDEATVTVTIAGVDDPAVVAGTFGGSVTEGDPGDTATATGTLSIADPDADDTPSFADTAGKGDNGYGDFSLTGGTWTYTLDQGTVQDLDAGDTVSDTFTFTATDGTEQAVTVTIEGTNDAPVYTPPSPADRVPASASGNPIALLSGARDPEGDALQLSGVAVTSDRRSEVGFTVSAAGALLLDPAQFRPLPTGATEALTLSFTLSDGALSTPATRNVTIEGVNDAPEAQDGLVFVPANALSVSGSLFTLNDTTPSDPDGDPLQVVSVAGTPVSGDSVSVTLPTGDTIRVGSDGAFFFEPFATTGLGPRSVSFDYTISDDGGLEDTASVTVALAAQVGARGQVVQYGLSDLATNPTIGGVDGAVRLFLASDSLSADSVTVSRAGDGFRIAVDVDGDGTPDNVISVSGTFSGGGFLTSPVPGTPGGGIAIEYVPDAPAVSENALLASGAVNGLVAPDFLIGDGTRGHVVTFTAETAAHDNAVGHYVIGADGAISDVRILFGNTNETAPGSRVALDPLAAGERHGFFLVSDGAEIADADTLVFVSAAGATANAFTPLAPRLLADGAVVEDDVFHIYDQLNTAGDQMVWSGFDPSDGGGLTIGFEDEFLAGADRDYNDVIIDVDIL